jgi:hypothetical protein
MVDPDKLKKVKWLKREFVRCGKKRCRKCQPGGSGHGPYWRGYWETGIVMRSVHIGRELPEELHALALKLGQDWDALKDIPGQLELEELPEVQPAAALESWRDNPAEVAEAMGVRWPATRERVRKFVANKLAAKQLDHNSKVALQSLFGRLCVLMSWSAPKA